MHLINKIATWFFVLEFLVYAIAPIVVSLPNADPQNASVFDEASPVRLMLFDIDDDGSNGKESALGAHTEESKDILLKKKRTITSVKVVPTVLYSASFAIPLSSEGRRIDFEGVYTTHSRLLAFLASGVSPPALSFAKAILAAPNSGSFSLPLLSADHLVSRKEVRTSYSSLNQFHMSGASPPAFS